MAPERFAADLAAARRRRAHHARPHPRRGRSTWIAASDAHGLDRVFLVAPSSTDERLASVTRNCRGFVYAASHMGVTGARASLGDAASVIVGRTKAVTDLPVCVGLGRLDARAGRRGRGLRRRGHRRLGAGALPHRGRRPALGDHSPARAGVRARRRRPGAAPGYERARGPGARQARSSLLRRPRTPRHRRPAGPARPRRRHARGGRRSRSAKPETSERAVQAYQLLPFDLAS